jgi:hypothetical protein
MLNMVSKSYETDIKVLEWNIVKYGQFLTKLILQ